MMAIRISGMFLVLSACKFSHYCSVIRDNELLVLR